MADEVLVTEFRLNNKMSAPLAALNQQVKGFLGTANTAANNALPSLASGIGLITAAATAGGVALLGFGNAASQADASFDTMRRTFAGALGSLEAGNQMMQYLEQYATRSAFSLEGLAGASKQLAATGLDVGRFLPIMERFALVSSGVDPEGLIQVAGALARAKSGTFGEAMEVFRKAGVGAQDLRAQGINVTKGGEVQATAEQFFDALQRISEGRLKTIADSISGGAENIRANVGDVAGQAFRQIGAEVNKTLLPILTTFTKEMSILVNSGALKTITDEFLGMAPSVTNIGAAMEELAVALAEIPGVIKTVTGGIRDSFNWLRDRTKDFDITGRIIDGVTELFTGSDLRTAFNNVYFPEGGAGDQVREQLKRARNAIVPPVEAPKSQETPAATVVDLSKQTATNTAKLVDLQQKQLDLSRQILGGGTVAGEATSAVRLDRALGGSLSRGERMVLEGMQEISRAYARTGIAVQRNNGVRGSTQVR